MEGAARILVTGATGSVGPSVAAALMAAGHQVRTLSRRPAAVLPEGVEARQGDVTDQRDVREAVEGVDVVLHLAGLLHIAPPYAKPEEYEKVNVGGTRLVVEEAGRAGVRRVVLFSTIALYGPSAGGLHTEDSLPAPDTPYGATKLAAERIVLAPRRADGAPLGTVLRLGAVYGPAVKGNYRRLLEALSGGFYVAVGKGENRRTLVYEKDAARAAVLAAFHPAAAGRVYNVTDGRLHTLAEIVAAICAALDRRPPRLRIPLGPARLLAAAADAGAALFGQGRPFGRVLEKYTEDMAVDGSRIQRELGFAPAYDLLEAWRETVAVLRARGEL